jgi:hypothetical protein
MAPLFNWLIRKPMVRVLLEHTVGIDRRRPIPPASRITFKIWFSKRPRPVKSKGPKAALFIDFSLAM